MANEKQREVGRQIKATYDKSRGNMAQAEFLMRLNIEMQRGAPLEQAESRVTAEVRETHPDFKPVRAT